MLLILQFPFLISLCGLDIEDPTPPSPPQWVQKSSAEEWPERGIDAHESGGIFLEWEPNAEENISAYLIYAAQYYNMNDSLGDYELLKRVETEALVELNFLHSEALQGLNYYYKLKAEDSSGNQSKFSSPIAYTLLPPIPDLWMSPNGNSNILNSARQLFWTYEYHVEMENYCLTILAQNNDFILRIIINPTNYVSGAETWYIPQSVILVPNQIYKWRIDTGANYIDNLETAGSESGWATFRYN
jgi:hypothetical protein